ncbi:MAG: IS256 family transposase [bacterium]|nr:IS256 family transposase [bacterium]MCP5043714.1 IS256 family transposase [bacterium]
MTHREDLTPVDRALAALAEEGFDGMAEAIAVLMNEAMKLERNAFLGAEPHERAPERRGYANGFKPKSVKTRVGSVGLQIPQVRDVEYGAAFYPQSLERGQRSERALRLAIAEMYVQGVSTRRVSEITQELCGLDVSSTDVSRAAKLLDEELEKWRNRPLGRFPQVIVDARYEKVRHAGSVRDCALLVAIGIDGDGKRSVLGTSVSLSEAEVHWRTFLASLQDRGLHGVELIISDAHAGLGAARKARFAGVAWQRCQFHLQQNAQSYVPRKPYKRKVAEGLRGVFNAADRADAERKLLEFVAEWGKKAPELAAWAEENVGESLTVFDLGLTEAQRKRLRTSNSLENLNQQIKRRTRVARLFPNEESLLRLASAVLMEISEEWETGRRYLPRNDA